MENIKLIEELQYYQLYFGKALRCGYINDKICDYFDDNPNKYRPFENSLGEISSALLHSQRVIFSSLLIEDKDSKHIRKLLNKLISIRVSNNDIVDKKIKQIAQKLLLEVQIQSANILELKEYRNKVFVHFDKKSFNDEWRNQFPLQNPCNFNEIINLAKQIYNGLYDIIVLLNGIPFSTSELCPNDINDMIAKLCN